MRIHLVHLPKDEPAYNSVLALTCLAPEKKNIYKVLRGEKNYIGYTLAM